MPKFQNLKLSDIDFADKSYIFRHAFDVSDLTNSIEFEGLIYPPIVVRRAAAEKHQIVAGYRRLLAYKKINIGF